MPQYPHPHCRDTTLPDRNIDFIFVQLLADYADFADSEIQHLCNLGHLRETKLATVYRFNI